MAIKKHNPLPNLLKTKKSCISWTFLFSFFLILKKPIYRSHASNQLIHLPVIFHVIHHIHLPIVL